MELLESNICINDGLFDIREAEPKMDSSEYLTSQICSAAQFETAIFAKWLKEIKEQNRYHRKQWEFVFILQALFERGLLRPGKKGLGFGVGQEPLAAVMAKHGVQILATDQNQEEAARVGWAQTQQVLTSLDVLNNRLICHPAIFQRLVKTREVDMNDIPEDIKDYDFNWSSCAFEHLGSIEHGLNFIKNCLKTLKPGGIAVHTTEYNLSSNDETLNEGICVIFRKQDFQKLIKELKAEHHEIYMNFNFHSQNKLDKVVDFPPYSSDEHLKLALGNYVTTSVGLIVRKNLN